MIRKFPDFDEYQVRKPFKYFCGREVQLKRLLIHSFSVQLGKYNKDTKPKKEKKTLPHSSSNKSEDEEEIEKMTFTLKQVCVNSYFTQ